MAYCYSCRAELGEYQGYMQSYCTTCQNRKILQEQMEENSLSQAQRQAEQLDRQEEFERQSIQVAKQNAALAREQARENSRLAAEGGVRYEDAYQYGLHYLEGTIGSTKFLDSYISNIGKGLEEDGTVYCVRNFTWEPYKMDHLNQAFDRGLKESVKDIVSPGLEYMKTCAYNAGFDLKSEFEISADVGIDNFKISETYTSNIKRCVDTDTGLVTYTWNIPFKNAELNQLYKNGVDAKMIELRENRDELVAERMKTEVVEILAQQVEAARIAKEEADRVRAYELERSIQWENTRREAITRKKNTDTIVIAIVLVIIASVVTLWSTNHGFIAILVAFVAGVAALGGAFQSLYD